MASFSVQQRFWWDLYLLLVKHYESAKMDIPEFEIRNLRRNELSQLKELTDEVDWNFQIPYLEECYNYAPENFHVAVTKDGYVLSHCTWLPLGGNPDSNTCFVGFFVTRKKYRGMGIGRQVFKALMESTGGRNALLNAIIGKEKIYERRGFKTGSLMIARYNCTAPGVPDPPPPPPEGVRLVDGRTVSFKKLQGYDENRIHPLPRPVALQRVLDQCQSCLVAMEVGKDGSSDMVVGWGAVRKSAKGFYLKPLYAEHSDIAKALAVALLAPLGGDVDIEVQVIDDNVHAHALLASLGMSPTGILDVRMYTQSDMPSQNPDLVYGMMDYDKSIV